MQVNISGQHVEVTQPLRDYVLEKLARVESHFDKITNVQVIMKVEKLQQKVEATLQIPGVCSDRCLGRQARPPTEKTQGKTAKPAARCSCPLIPLIHDPT